MSSVVPPEVQPPRRHPSPSLVPNRDWTVHRARGAAMSVLTVSSDCTNAVVKVAGELDMATAAPLWAVLESHLGAGRRFLRLDMSQLTFLDATALSGITAVHGHALAARGTLVLTGVRPAIAKVLHLTGLDEMLFVSGPRSDLDHQLDAHPSPGPAD